MPPLTVGSDELSNMLGKWTTGSATLVEDLVEAIVGLVDGGLLPVGIGMPSQRVLATSIGVSRGTVTSVYEVLEARGYFLTRPGSGTRVRSDRTHVHTRTSGRLFSFTDAPPNVNDLSTGALPPSMVAREIIAGRVGRLVDPYLSTDGYFPAGLPVLRRALADQMTADGIPTSPKQLLITAGAQQAAWLTLTALLSSGDRVIVEEPTYRGALEVMRSLAVRVEGIPLVGGGLDPTLVRRALERAPAALYCQTGIHNPTGQTMRHDSRTALTEAINRSGIVTIDDRSSADLTFSDPWPAPGLVGLVDEELLISLGSASKLFWGGLRVGWIRTSETRIETLTEILKGVDLACSIHDQVLVATMLARSDEARAERRATLGASLASAERILREVRPDWEWVPISGGSGLWVDTHEDTVRLAGRAKRVGVRLAPGPNFSPYGGQRTMLRLPVWHESSQLRDGMEQISSIG